jgi:hypothetical protein
MMKELFGIVHIRDDEEEVPNAKRMRIVEEVVSLSQLVTAAVVHVINFDCFRVLFVVRFSKLNCLLIADRCQLHAGKGNFLCHTSIFNNLYFNY